MRGIRVRLQMRYAGRWNAGASDEQQGAHTDT